MMITLRAFWGFQTAVQTTKRSIFQLFFLVFRSGLMWLQPLSLEPSCLEEEFHLASSEGSREVDDVRPFIGFQGGREQREMRKHRQVGFYRRFHIISRCWFSKFFFIFTPTC